MSEPFVKCENVKKYLKKGDDWCIINNNYIFENVVKINLIGKDWFYDQKAGNGIKCLHMDSFESCVLDM